LKNQFDTAHFFIYLRRMKKILGAVITLGLLASSAHAADPLPGFAFEEIRSVTDISARVINPTYKGMPISLNANLLGVCKGMGLGESPYGAAEKASSSLEVNVADIDAEAKFIGLDYHVRSIISLECLW
jgi:hypothetical protein